jgi:hypothetical protein
MEGFITQVKNSIYVLMQIRLSYESTLPKVGILWQRLVKVSHIKL